MNKKPYNLSEDYRLLKKLLDNGKEIVCFFDEDVCLGCVTKDKRYHFTARRVLYNDFSADCSYEYFSEMMSQDNVKFIIPDMQILAD